MHDLENRVVVLLVVAVTLLFGWILWPFSGAILWAVVLATMFSPIHRRVLIALPRWPNVAALLTLLLVIVMVILPLLFVTTLLLQEAVELYGAYEAGELNLGDGLQRMRDALPAWATALIERVGAANLTELRERLSGLMVESGRFLAGQAINLGQGTINVLIGFAVMLYLLYFLLRDGHTLRHRMSDAIPLRADQKSELAEQFAVTIRATVKGILVVALVQGALGGLIFWVLDIRAPLLWGACMAVLSVLPVIGAGLVWAPFAIYLMVSGAIWQGVLLMAFGVLVIGLVDNVLRPILVGKDTQIPDYVVLIATLGGISVFGVNGLVIGPVVAAIFLAAWHVFSVRRSEQKRPDADPPVRPAPP
jgi:predicted PurR-regulated permease PerM